MHSPPHIFMLCFSPSELRKYFHKHHYFTSKGLPPLLIISCFHAILSSLPSSSQSQTPHGPGVCHIFSITQTILKGSQLHPPKLQLCLEPTTVLRLAGRSSDGSLHVSALPSRGLLPHTNPSTNSIQGRTKQMGLHPDSTRAQLHISGSIAFFPWQCTWCSLWQKGKSAPTAFHKKISKSCLGFFKIICYGNDRGIILLTLIQITSIPLSMIRESIFWILACHIATPLLF